RLPFSARRVAPAASCSFDCTRRASAKRQAACKIVITSLKLSKLCKHSIFAIDHFSATFIMEIDLELRIARFPPLTHPANLRFREVGERSLPWLPAPAIASKTLRTNCFKWLRKFAYPRCAAVAAPGT